MNYHIKYKSHITGSKNQTQDSYPFDEAIEFVRSANIFYKRRVSHCLVEAKNSTNRKATKGRLR